ncbi:hypothetical protein DV096_13955 [Bradymonadaceae bacterium TMQ3]|nr:hypothetical protein DV096_13955 [Bradymonadaceae bacterium TMQ3]TXC75155.1 hypothetical protein FRC91_13825 [Bradymonadales bacterium TMQ1]
MTDSKHNKRSMMSRRRFIVVTASGLLATACGSGGSGRRVDAADTGDAADTADAGGPGDGGGSFDTGSIDANVPTPEPNSPWQLAEGHYEGYFPQHVIYPRPDSETEAYARHRHAYPGVLYEIPIGVQFGKWPYRYELLEGPAGARVVHETLEWNGDDAFIVPEGYGVVAWDVPHHAPAGPHTFRVRVYDQDHGRAGDSFVDVTWTTAVGTSNFIFLDPIHGDDASADGSINAPFREIAALQDSGLAGNKICYIRQTEPFDPDDSLFAGGYAPSPPRQFSFGLDSEPKAYVAFPGEVVHINTANQRAFAQSSTINHDVFFDRIVTAYTNQNARDRDNVRVIMHWSKSHRSTFWRMGCMRAYGGNRKDDNHGFIWYWNDGGSVDDATGHTYLYSADCWMDRMNVDPGPDAPFEGVGANGPHLWETYTTNRTLAERHRITNSHIINNGFVIVKGSARDAEIRACVSVEGNRGNYHIRGLGADSNGETRRVALCYNRTGGEEGRVAMGQAGTNPAYEDIIAYRNSCAGSIGASQNPEAFSHAYNNITRTIAENVKEQEGNIEFGDNLQATFDDAMRLVGEARAAHLGLKGAEVA